jgi:hypothetical protein
MKGKTDRFGKFFLYVGVEIIFEFLTLKESFLLSQIYEAETNKNSNFNPTWTSIQTCASRTKTNWNVERKKKSQLKTEANVLWCLWGRKYLKTFFCFTPLNLSDVLSGNLSFCMLWQVICSAALFQSFLSLLS